MKSTLTKTLALLLASLMLVGGLAMDFEGCVNAISNLLGCGRSSR